MHNENYYSTGKKKRNSCFASQKSLNLKDNEIGGNDSFPENEFFTE